KRKKGTGISLVIALRHRRKVQPLEDIYSLDIKIHGIDQGLVFLWLRESPHTRHTHGCASWLKRSIAYGFPLRGSWKTCIALKCFVPDKNRYDLFGTACRSALLPSRAGVSPLRAGV